MPSFPALLRNNSPYAFIAVGLIWLAVAFIAGSTIILWPVVLCIASGLFLKMRPGQRITWAWATSSAAMGFIVSGYQAYYWVPLASGSLSSLAALSAGAFAVFAVAHVFLLYAGATSQRTVI